MSNSTTAPNRARKIRALLAGGLVLGVGAAVTLAAWTDEEWAIGNFGAGNFNIQGSTTGEEADFTDHPSQGEAAELDFQIAGDNLSPTDTVAAPFVLRTDAATTYDATVELTSASGEGANAENLTYGITQVESAAECTEGATGTEIVPSGTALDSMDGATGFELIAGADDAAGAPVTLCFQVTAGDDLVQGESGTANWGLTATSVE